MKNEMNQPRLERRLYIITTISKQTQYALMLISMCIFVMREQISNESYSYKEIAAYMSLGALFLTFLLDRIYIHVRKLEPQSAKLFVTDSVKKTEYFAHFRVPYFTWGIVYLVIKIFL